MIGPQNHREYHGAPFPDLDALASDLELDYVLNGRYLEASPGVPATC